MVPSPEIEILKYPALESEIAALKEFATPLNEEVVVTPLMPEISRIISLPDKLDNLSPQQIAIIEREVKECKRVLEAVSYRYVKETISKAQPSNVFRILASANEFEAHLRRKIGKVIDVDGEKVEISEAMVKALTKFRFSLGSPPVTPKAIDSLEKILFGGNLQSIYAFRDLLDSDGRSRLIFDRFIAQVSQLVEQSTHYTTGHEKKQYEKDLSTYSGFEGVSGFKKIIVTGNAKTVKRLIDQHLLSKHGENGSRPVEYVTERDKFDEGLIERMEKEKGKIFVVRATKIPSTVFTSDELHGKWEGVIGRLLIVDDSEMSHKTGTTTVYTLNPPVKEQLEQFHVKDYGTPSNTQLNLRRILESFSSDDLNLLRQNVDNKIQKYEQEEVHLANATAIRRQKWLVTRQNEYLSLKKFQKFLDFLKDIDSHSGQERTQFINQMMAEAEQLTMKYFFNDLPDGDYGCAYVPEGGGRRELGHIAAYNLKKQQKAVEDFRVPHLEKLKERLGKLKGERGIGPYSTQVEVEAVKRSRYERGVVDVPDVSEGPGYTNSVKLKAQEGLTDGVSWAQRNVTQLREAVREFTRANLSGKAHELAAGFLKSRDAGSFIKIGERGVARQVAHGIRQVTGLADRAIGRLTDKTQGKMQALKRSQEYQTLDLAETLLNEIDNGTFRPRIAAGKIKWTIDDVFIEEDYPAKNYLTIDLDSEGEIDPDSLERKLEGIAEELREFPELFKLYCSSIIIYVNDPHNPTSRVMSPSAKIGLLRVASKYGLTICSDEAYRKQISSEKKKKQGDWSLAQFYEENRTVCPNPITIHTAQANTKFLGGGKRTGVIITNEEVPSGEEGLLDHVRKNTNSANTMSMYMDIEGFRTGVIVKKVCKALERTAMGYNPDKIIEELLEKQFGKLDAPDFCAPVYFKLIQARNDLDRLKVRTSNPVEYAGESRIYINRLLKDLKDFRVEKISQRDTEKRLEAALAAVERIAQGEHPEIKTKYIKPEGPFYMCLELDPEVEDKTLMQFLLALAKSRNIDAVPQSGGYIRLAFGGMIDGSPQGYELLSKAIETNLNILLKYWKRFKELVDEYNQKGEPLAERKALKELFPGGEVELANALAEKGELNKAIFEYEKTKDAQKKLTYTHRASVDRYLSRIEPGSNAHIITIRDVQCDNVEEFVHSKTFRDLYNHYLLEVKSKVPMLRHMEDKVVIAKYGAIQFAMRRRDKRFQNEERIVFAAIVSEISAVWFSDDTIKIMAKEGENITPEDIRGTSEKLSDFIKEALKSFLTKEQEQALVLRINKRANPEYVGTELKFKPTFQAGYNVVRGVKAHPDMMPWASKMIEKAEFVGKTVATDPSPEMTTESKLRVPGVDRAIFRRDGDGTSAPKRDYFSNCLGDFQEKMNPKDYPMKMVFVGGTKVLVIMDRAYSHYIVEELRLFPQFDIKPEDLANLRPDAISFLGLPTNVMGEDYRIGYFMDQNGSGEDVPVSWVDKENITDYMGYFKKPILTVANEKMKEREIFPIHGSAITVNFKNGLRKTLVFGGDSGTGKSETVIAMMEKLVNTDGGDSQVESIDIIAGDMLSMFIGADKAKYVIGTEQGDFMRMTDITSGWKERFRDILEKASKTNLNDEKNPRATVSNICDIKAVAMPTRVNFFMVINNFEQPPGESAFMEVEDALTLLNQQYVEGYRGEKGTSGDQPNFYAGVLYSKVGDRGALLKEFGKKLDDFLSWEILTNKRGKAANAILQFKENDKKANGDIVTARRMVEKLFQGKTLKRNGKAYTITGTEFEAQENRFYLEMRSEDGEMVKELIRRDEVYAKIYPAIASTYCGNPFVDPEGMNRILNIFGTSMRDDKDFITGILYTQLKRRGMETDGPLKAAEAIIGFITGDKRINERFQKHKKEVNEALCGKYGDALLKIGGGEGAIPVEIEKHNLYMKEMFDNRTIRPVNSMGETIPLKTQLYEYKEGSEDKKFECELATPEVKEYIASICQDEELDLVRFEVDTSDLSDYASINAWDDKEELIYQILICQGRMKLGYEPLNLSKMGHHIKKAEKIADAMIKMKGVRYRAG